MKCNLCQSTKVSLSHSTIREGKGQIYKCVNCSVNYLRNQNRINYNKDYGTKLYDKSWGIDKQIEVRSKTLENVTKELIQIIKKEKFKKVLELGSGCGSTLIDISKKNLKIELSSLEQNKLYNSNLKKYIDIKIHTSANKLTEKYDFIYGIHFIEHLNNPIEFLKKIRLHLKRNGLLFLITPNHDDFYMNILPNDKKDSYKSFIYHLAHPFYYNIDSINFLLNKSGFKNISTFTDQDYPITNFIHWYSNGKPNKNIIEAQELSENFKNFNKTFIKFCNKNNLGCNLHSISKIK